MTAQDQAAATNRMRRALLAFHGAQTLLLKSHRDLKSRSAEEVEGFWAGLGAKLEQHVQATAAEVVAAFRVFSAARLVASAEDRHHVTEAQRHVAESKT
jgi:hypothetical protein